MSLVLFNSICLPQICFKVFSSLKNQCSSHSGSKAMVPIDSLTPMARCISLNQARFMEFMEVVLFHSFCQPFLWKIESGPIHTTIWRLNCVYGRRQWSAWPATQIFKSCLCLSLYSAGLSFVLWVLVLFWVLLYVPFWSNVLCGLQKNLDDSLLTSSI